MGLFENVYNFLKLAEIRTKYIKSTAMHDQRNKNLLILCPLHRKKIFLIWLNTFTIEFDEKSITHL